MFISNEKIDEIRETADIVEFISGYVDIKKKGKNYFGLCPFHLEKTPSFSVNPEKQIFHCFGCGEGGNIFSFIMKIEKISFPEAIEFLADKLRIPIKKEGAKGGEKKENLYAVNDRAGQWFNTNLVSEKKGKRARDYLTGRGITGNIIDIFSIGYAPDEWDGLIKHFGSEQRANLLLEKVGLIIPREKGSGYYDRFRDRVMFPIKNEFGKIVGFGGRKLKEEDTGGKYMNSPETVIYNKRSILYGLYEAKSSIKEKGNVIIVEGYIDVISLYMEGITNVVAPLGTSLTQEQAKSLSRYLSKVIMLFDADEAGLKATIRAAEVLLENNMDLEIVVMPKGEDPDSYIRKNGVDKFNVLLEKRISLVDFLGRLYMKRYTTPIERTNFLNEILTFFSNISDNIKRGYIINELSTPLEMNPVELQEKTVRLMQKKKINSTKEEEHRFDEEEELLRLFFVSSEASEIILKELELSWVRNGRIRKLFELLFSLYNDNKTVDSAKLIDLVETEEEKKYLSGLMFDRARISKDIEGKFGESTAEEIVRKTILGKRKRMIDIEINKIRIKLKKESDNEEVLKEYMDLLNKSKELGRQLNDL